MNPTCGACGKELPAENQSGICDDCACGTQPQDIAPTGEPRWIAVARQYPPSYEEVGELVAHVRELRKMLHAGVSFVDKHVYHARDNAGLGPWMIATESLLARQEPPEVKP